MSVILGTSVRAQPKIEISQPNPAASQLSRQELEQLLGAKLRGKPASVIDRAKNDFLQHLRDTAPIVSEDLAEGRMTEDDLTSRIDIFLADHPEYSGTSTGTAAIDPHQRVADVMRSAPDLARTDAERNALADRFIKQLGNQSGTSLNELLAGRMSGDELQSRVSVFVGDLRAEAARVATDPSQVAVPPIVEAYIKANLGSVTDRADSICYRGSVVEGAHTRDFVVFKKRPNLLRIHIVKQDVVIGVLGYDGGTAWTESPGRPPVPVTKAQEDELARTAQFDDPLVGYRERGAVVRLQDRPANGPIQLHVLETDGTESLASIDPVDYREVSLKTRKPGGKWHETQFKDYRRVGAVNVSFLQEEWVDDAPFSTTRLTSVNLDPGLLDQFFVKPTAVAFGFMDFMGAVATMEAREKHSKPDSLPTIGIAR